GRLARRCGGRQSGRISTRNGKLELQVDDGPARPAGVVQPVPELAGQPRPPPCWTALPVTSCTANTNSPRRGSARPASRAVSVRHRRSRGQVGGGEEHVEQQGA